MVQSPAYNSVEILEQTQDLIKGALYNPVEILELT